MFEQRPNDDMVVRSRAILDQRLALLRDMVSRIHRHRPSCLIVPLCLGPHVNDQLQGLSCHDRDELLWAALIELADREWQSLPTVDGAP